MQKDSHTYMNTHSHVLHTLFDSTLQVNFHQESNLTNTVLKLCVLSLWVQKHNFQMNTHALLHTYTCFFPIHIAGVHTNEAVLGR